MCTVDFASELVGLLAVHAPRLTPTPLPDLAQPLKEQDTAGVVRAHLSNAVCDFLCCVLVHATDMPPELLVTVLPFDWFSRKMLLFRDALQVLEACLIESMIGDKQRPDARVVLPHRFPLLPKEKNGGAWMLVAKNVVTQLDL